MSLLQRIKKSIGPGVITGIADDDPSGIATYAQTGAMFGYGQLWFALFAFPFMVAIQEMCGRIGMVTGNGLAGIIKKHYSYKVLVFSVALLAIANIINIGADLNAMADAATLILPIPFSVSLISITLFTLLIEIFVPYPTYVKFLKYVALTVFAYVLAAFFVNQNWREVFTSFFIPHISLTKEYLFNITALLGTTISPYLFFWQADEEAEEEIVQGKISAIGKEIPTINGEDISQMRYDTAIGMFVSNAVTFFIIITAAATLHAQGITSITSAAEMASALTPLAGNFASLLFSIAIIGTGLLAVPVLAGSAAYALSETFGWRAGLGETFTRAKAFYITIIIATLLGLLVNFSSIGSITMLYYAAILNGILAPPLMILILLIANNKNIMGVNTNNKLSNYFGWTITICMSIIAIIFIGNLLL